MIKSVVIRNLLHSRDLKRNTLAYNMLYENVILKSTVIGSLISISFTHNFSIQCSIGMSGFMVIIIAHTNDIKRRLHIVDILYIEFVVLKLKYVFISVCRNITTIFILRCIEFKKYKLYLFDWNLYFDLTNVYLTMVTIFKWVSKWYLLKYLIQWSEKD